MKCPELEQLMLYVDNELDSKEAADIRAHLAVCKNCRLEVASLKDELESEALIREQVNKTFAKRSVSNKIMAAVMAEPRPVAKKAEKAPFWSNWLVRLMVPALALVIGLVFFMGKEPETPTVYSGKVYKVSVFTNTTDCLVDNMPIAENKAFTLEASSFKQLSGNFLVNVVSNDHTFSLDFKGKGNLGFDEESMLPVFNDCLADIQIVNGNNANLMVNGKKVSVTKQKPIKLAPIEEQIEKAIIEKPVKDKESTIHPKEEKKSEEKPKLEVKVEPIEEFQWEEPRVVKPKEEANTEGESLTDNLTGGISIIDTARDSELDNISPFADQVIGNH